MKAYTVAIQIAPPMNLPTVAAADTEAEHHEQDLLLNSPQHHRPDTDQSFLATNLLAMGLQQHFVMCMVMM